MKKLIILLIIFCSSLYSQETYVWESLDASFGNVREIINTYNGKPYVTTTSNKVYTSDDLGDTWYEVDNGSSSLSPVYVIETDTSLIYFGNRSEFKCVDEAGFTGVVVQMPQLTSIPIAAANSNHFVVTDEHLNKVFYGSAPDFVWDSVEISEKTLAVEYFEDSFYILDEAGILGKLNLTQNNIEPITQIYADETADLFSGGNKLCVATDDTLHYSTNSGSTWNKIEIQGRVIVALDQAGRIYSSFESEYFVSDDNGENWVSINLAPDYTNGTVPALDGDVKFSYNWGLKRCNTINPFVEPDVDFMNLHVGNKWLYRATGSNSGYWHKMIVSDTTINNNTWYIFSNQDILRYDKNSKILYKLVDGNEIIDFDFSIPACKPIEKYPTGGFKVVSSHNSEYFGKVIYNKGYTTFTGDGLDGRYYGDGLGYTGSDVINLMPLYESGSELIESYVYNDSSREFELLTQGYKPNFLSVTGRLNDSDELKISAIVSHNYDSDISFVNWVDIYYSIVSESDSNGIFQARLDYDFALKRFEYTSEVDSIYLNKGYNFKYALIAADKGLVTDSVRYPTFGWRNIELNSLVGMESNTSGDLIEEYKLSDNYPNPFNPETTIQYSLKEAGNVELIVYDVLGNEVAKLVNGYKPAGTHEVTFNATNLPSGVYIYRIKSEEYSESKKMILLK